MAQTAPAPSATLIDRIQYVFLRAGEIFFRVLPRSTGLALARLLGWLGYYVLPARKRVMLENLRIAFPDMPVAEREKESPERRPRHLPLE
jgi:lauroyl/myristoyl acyltransferase